MLYTAKNAAGATVYEVESMGKLDRVLSVDTETSEVVRCHDPIRVQGDEIVTYTERFDAIHPIHGVARQPVLFHCYGRQAA